MLAAPLPDRAAAAPHPSAELEPRVAALVESCLSLWRRTPEATPQPGPRRGAWRRWRSYRRARALVDWAAGEIERYPAEASERPRWRARLRERVQRFGEDSLGWPPAYRDLLFADEFFAATQEFVRAGRAFDAGLRAEDLGQALRNVWIMNSLQMLFGLPVELTPPIFAYSLLYPYTDNLLDDPAVPGAAKRRFNRRLARRLAGLPEPAESERERRVWQLVGTIEEHFPRATHPEVHASLLAIHGAQTASLAQQRAGGGLDGDDLLRLTFRKGGSSVLPDGTLLTGRLGADELDFCFGYGVFLQLLDDLQDVAADRAAGHRTPFSVTAGRAPLDRPASRLYHFMGAVLDGARVFDSLEGEAVRDLIRRNCTFLLVAAVAENAAFFTRPFRRRLERGWPLGLRAMRRLRLRLERRGRETRATIERRPDSASLLDLVG